MKKKIGLMGLPLGILVLIAIMALPTPNVQMPMANPPARHRSVCFWMRFRSSTSASLPSLRWHLAL